MSTSAIDNTKPSVLIPTALPGTRWRDVLTHHGFEIVDDPSGDPREHTAVISQLSSKWNEDTMRSLPGGFVISNFAVGFDNIDVAAAEKINSEAEANNSGNADVKFGEPRAKITVCNCPGVLTAATADLAIALTLSAARRLVEGQRFIEDGSWAKSSFDPCRMLGERLDDKTVGVFGCGRIGSDYAVKMALLHRVDIVYFSRTRKPDLEARLNTIADLHEAGTLRGRRPKTSGDDDSTNSSRPRVIHRTSLSDPGAVEDLDVLSLHAPLTPSTRHSVTQEILSRMKLEAILVNTGRGPLVDEKALSEHLLKHKSFHAALDVFENEPVVDEKLKNSPHTNVTMVPHVGSATKEVRAEMSVIAALNVVGAVNGWERHEDSDDMSRFLEGGEIADIPRATPSVLVG